MEESKIRQYAKLMQELDLTGLEIRESDEVVRLERTPQTAVTPIPVPASIPVAMPSAEPTAPVVEEAGIVNITAPMVGVFYASPAENQPPFITLGDTIHKGDVLCIIEAMKLMNEIVSDYDGTVVEICVGDNQVVDFGHVLFRIRKEAP